MKNALVLLLLLVACDKPAARPSEAKFRAADAMEKCKLTEPRAIRCSDELIVAELRSMGGSDTGADELANVVAADLEKDSKRVSPEELHALHKTRCMAGEAYAERVFDCWSVADCKQFAACVMKK